MKLRNLFKSVHIIAFVECAACCVKVKIVTKHVQNYGDDFNCEYECYIYLEELPRLCKLLVNSFIYKCNYFVFKSVECVLRMCVW